MTHQETDNSIHTILAEKHLDENRQAWSEVIQAKTPNDVQRALAQPVGKYDFDKLLCLVSPAAADYLEQMAQLAAKLTIQRFGRTIQLYAPLYVSNFCRNHCRYCGYNAQSKFTRNRLTIEQALADAEIIASEGFRNILIVSGEDPEFISVEYLCELAGKLRRRFSSISIEIYPMSKTQYADLFAAGIDGVTLYQETYNRETYTHYHPDGPKADYDSRLNAHDRTASAGMRRLGLGVLLGLSNWQLETLALAEHAHYLMKRYWKSRISFSFPRLRPAHDVAEQFPYTPTDKEMVQMILALRLCFADAGLILSTRENANLRNHLIHLGITNISAGSKTNPGGYSSCVNATEQFEIDDKRSPTQIAEMIKRAGFEPVWKDWDAAFTRK